MKDQCKSKKILLERLEHGMDDIHVDILGNESREEYTLPWYDNYLLGTLYMLLTSKKPLSFKEIGRLIGWRWRTVKNAIRSLNTSINSKMCGVIKISKLHVPCSCCKCKVRFYIDPSFMKDHKNNINGIMKAFCRGYYLKDNVNLPNMSEAETLSVCNELYNGYFIYTGTRTLKNRVGRYYPDIQHKIYPIIIEHNGSIYHRDKDREEARLEYLRSMGYYVLVITDYSDKKRLKIKQQIKSFVDNAIKEIEIQKAA